MTPSQKNENALAALELAQTEVERLCSGERWRMTIPANEKHDSDIIISTAITLAIAALSQPTTGEAQHYEQVGWYDPDEPGQVWNMDDHDDDLSEFHAPVYAKADSTPLDGEVVTVDCTEAYEEWVDEQMQISPRALKPGEAWKAAWELALIQSRVGGR